MRWIFLVLLCLLSAACSAAATQEFSSANLARPSDLANGTGDGSVTVPGDLRLPEGDGKFPIVIYMHGSGGPLPRHENVWLRRIRELGFATFQIDSFRPRGVSSTVGNQGAVTSYSMTRDVFAASEMLAGLPNVDPKRIGIMGSSKGGVVALLSSKRSWQQRWNASLAFHIALYPFCQTYETYDIEAPVLVMSGKKDEWVGHEFCATMVEEMKAAGVNAQFKLYDAYHGWDGTPGIRLVRRADGYAQCRLRLGDDGIGFSLRSGLPIENDADLERELASCKVEGGQYIGRNDRALEASLADVLGFLSEFR